MEGGAGRAGAGSDAGGADAHGHALACDVARDAWRFLSPLGVAGPPRVPIRLVEQLPIDPRADAAGCCLSGTRSVHVLTLPRAALAYVAYVSMFATMDAETRARVLSAMPLDALDHDAEINDMRYAFDPMRFGVEAYRHWRRQRDGMAFLGEVIRGRVALELSTP